jgi:type I restriction enzyme S subunit
MSTATLHIENKKTLIPQLRFRDFEGEWKLEKFGKLATNKSGKFNPVKESSFTKCIELEHLGTETGQLLGFIDGSNSGSIKNKFNEGDVLFGKLRPYLKKYLQPSFEGVCSSEIWVLKGVKISNSFLYRIVQTDKFIDLANQSSGSKMPRADWNVVENGIFSFPTLPEQQKIASFLSAVDEKIQQLSRKKELLEQYKKGVMQQLFSGELRFKDENGKDYADWKENNLGKYLSYKSNRNKDFGVELVLSVSNKKGFITQNEQFDGYEVASKDLSNYKIVDKNDIAYNPSRINVGSIARLVNYEKGIVSPMYVVFSLKDNLDKLFFENLYNTHRFKHLIKIGCSGSVRDSLNFEDLAEFCFSFPSLKEQQKIADFLSSIDAKIESTSQQINQTQSFKKGLLQQLFV